MGHFPHRSRQGLCPPCGGRGHREGVTIEDLFTGRGDIFRDVSGASPESRDQAHPEGASSCLAAEEHRQIHPRGAAGRLPRAILRGHGARCRPHWGPLCGQFQPSNSGKSVPTTSRHQRIQKQPVLVASGLDGRKAGALSCRAGLGYQESRAGGWRVPSVQLESPQAY